MSTVLDFADMFDKYVGSLTKEWKYDRDKTLGASEAFGCIRKAFFQKNGYKKDEDYEESWGATHRGDLIENHLVVPAVEYGLPLQAPKAKLLGGGDDQTTILDKLKKNSATPDGLITNLSSDALSKYGVEDIEGDCIMLEIKSIDPRVNLRQEKAIHSGQVQQQLGIIRQRTPFKPMYAAIVYVDASFHDNIKVFAIRYDERKWQAAQKRAKLLFSATDPGHLRPEGKFDDSCKYCPFKQVCAEATIGAMPPKDENRETMKQGEDEELKKLILEERKMNAAADGAIAEREKAKQAVREHLQACRRRTAQGAGWKVSWYSNPGQKRLDKERLAKDAGVDLADYMEEGKPFDVLRITVDEDLG